MNAIVKLWALKNLLVRGVMSWDDALMRFKREGGAAPDFLEYIGPRHKWELAEGPTYPAHIVVSNTYVRTIKQRLDNLVKQGDPDSLALVEKIFNILDDVGTLSENVGG